MRKPHHQFEDYKIGDEITILRGPYEDFAGVIYELHPSSKTIRVKVIVENREISLNFNAKQIRIPRL